jgi:hypothetical protein
MINKAILVLVVLTLAVVAIAGTVPSGGNNYRVTLLQASVVNGTELKAGDYKLNVNADKITISGSNKSVEVGVKVENVESKFEHTAIRYTQENGKAVISEIRVGGTTTKLVFNR